MVAKQTKARKSGEVYYRHKRPSTCFGHSCCHF